MKKIKEKIILTTTLISIGLTNCFAMEKKHKKNNDINKNINIQINYLQNQLCEYLKEVKNLIDKNPEKALYKFYSFCKYYENNKKILKDQNLTNYIIHIKILLDNLENELTNKSKNNNTLTTLLSEIQKANLKWFNSIIYENQNNLSSIIKMAMLEKINQSTILQTVIKMVSEKIDSLEQKNKLKKYIMKLWALRLTPTSYFYKTKIDTKTVKNKIENIKNNIYKILKNLDKEAVKKLIIEIYENLHQNIKMQIEKQNKKIKNIILYKYKNNKYENKQKYNNLLEKQKAFFFDVRKIIKLVEEIKEIAERIIYNFSTQNNDDSLTVNLNINKIIKEKDFNFEKIKNYLEQQTDQIFSTLKTIENFDISFNEDTPKFKDIFSKSTQINLDNIMKEDNVIYKGNIIEENSIIKDNNITENNSIIEEDSIMENNNIIEEENIKEKEKLKKFIPYLLQIFYNDCVNKKYDKEILTILYNLLKNEYMIEPITRENRQLIKIIAQVVKEICNNLNNAQKEYIEDLLKNINFSIKPHSKHLDEIDFDNLKNSTLKQYDKLENKDKNFCIKNINIINDLTNELINFFQYNRDKLGYVDFYSYMMPENENEIDNHYEKNCEQNFKNQEDLFFSLPNSSLFYDVYTETEKTLNYMKNRNEKINIILDTILEKLKTKI